MSISGAVPIRDREKAILEELRKEAKPVKTGILTERVLARFGLSASEKSRRTPGGYPWWTGCIRLDLDRMRKHGEVRRPIKEYWEIVGDDGNASTKPGPDKFSRRALNLVAELVRDAKSGDVPVSITMRQGEFTIRFGENVQQTSTEIAQ